MENRLKICPKQGCNLGLDNWGMGQGGKAVISLIIGDGTEGMRQGDRAGGTYLFLNKFVLKSIVFMVCEHEYTNMCPRPIIDLATGMFKNYQQTIE